MNVAECHRILVRGVNWLGDAVMTTPALLRLREAFPAAHITLLTPAKLRDLWHEHPAINAVETFAADESVCRVNRRMRAGKFDLALVLPNSPRSALEVFSVPQRVGYARPWRNWLLTRAVAARSGAVFMHKRSEAEIKELVRRNAPPVYPPPNAHHIYNYLHLTAALGANPAPLPPQLNVPQASVTQFLAKFNLSADPVTPLFGLNAGAEYGPAKRWPEERFIETALEVQKLISCRWIVFGLKNEADMAARIVVKIPSAMSLAGQTSLGELAAAFKSCRLLLTNDSGPMHLAAAVGTPVIVPFGSTSPELTGPGLPGDTRHQLLRVNIPCSPCFLRECPIDFRCMTGITVDAAVQAVLKVARQ